MRICLIGAIAGILFLKGLGGSFRVADAPSISLFYPVPLLENACLQLRPWAEFDQDQLKNIFYEIDFTFMLFESTESSWQSLFDLLIQGEHQGTIGVWAITLQSSSELIGLCWYWNLNRKNASGELTLFLKSNQTQKGFGTHVISLIVHYLFQQGLNRLSATAHPDNLSSIKILKKNGFKEVELIKESHYYKGAYHDRILMTLLKNDFIFFK